MYGVWCMVYTCTQCCSGTSISVLLKPIIFNAPLNVFIIERTFYFDSLRLNIFPIISTSLFVNRFIYMIQAKHYLNDDRSKHYVAVITSSFEYFNG